MTGIFLLGVLAVWLALVAGFAYALTKSIKSDVLRYSAFLLAVACLFPLIVIDELVTAPQFAKLCKEGTKLKFDPDKIRGKTIFFEAVSPPPRFSVGLLQGYYLNWHYLDASTKEVLISEKTYVIQGGVLIRTLGISETTSPLLMESSCGPSEHPNQKRFLDRYNMKFIEEKDIK